MVSEATMMHDVDDATLMQALRHADPRRGSTLDDHARRRLEQSWREAMAAPEGSPARPRTIGALGRSVQPVAAAIMTAVILAGGVLVASVVAQRGEGVTDTQPDAAGVEGSYRAVQQRWDMVDTFLVAGGRVLLQPSGAAWDHYPASQWPGFGEAARLRITQAMLDGDQMYVRIGANGENQSRWYRYSGSRPQRMPRMAVTPLPVFEQGTRGFERVNDQDAHAKGLTRYTADADAADLEFLGWFSETSGAVTTVDIWVDADGRVRRLEKRRQADPDTPVITQFDRFDAVDPIDPPYSEDADAPVARDVVGAALYAYGDPAFADELRDRVTAELDGDADIAEYEIFERSAEDNSTYDPVGEHELFLAAVRFADDVVADWDAQLRMMDPFASLTAGDVPANVTPGDGPPRGSDPQGYAAFSQRELHQWITLDG
jgi:hypothetical protein